jgi:Rrf2 family protein
VITRSGVQSILALVALADVPPGRYLGAGAIAKKIGARPNYLGKLLKVLAREGIVVSQKGMGGGFRLARDPEQIRLLDVLEPIEQPTRWSGCFMGRSECTEEDPCAIHDRWVVVKEVYIAFLAESSIADLMVRDDGPSGAQGSVSNVG